MKYLGQLNRKLDGLASEFSDRAVGRLGMRAGMEAKKDVEQAVRADIGDLSMSGWRRAAPIQIKARFDVDGSSVTVSPVRPARGPMRVLEQGRNQGNAGGFAGPGINRKTGVTSRTKSGGVRRQRSRAAKRWNGRTVGKGTWSDARRAIERETPRRIAKEVPAAIRRGLRG